MYIAYIWEVELAVKLKPVSRVYRGRWNYKESVYSEILLYKILRRV